MPVILSRCYLSYSSPWKIEQGRGRGENIVRERKEGKRRKGTKGRGGKYYKGEEEERGGKYINLKDK